jgi:two-component system, NarL family, nitrate/nitrite response regulator NarL
MFENRPSERSAMMTDRAINGLENRIVPASPAILETSTSAGRPRIFIVSDVRLYREGLAWSLSQRLEIEVTGAAAPTAATLQEIGRLAVTAVLLDIAMSGVLDLAREIVRLAPGIKIIAFAVNEVDHELMACAEAGIAGYVTRDSSVDDLVTSILGALRGELVCSPRLAGLLLQRVAVLSRTRQEPCEHRTLTRREREIMELVQLGQSNKEIARSLRIGPATVKNHVHNILDKLQVNRRGEAAARLRGDVSGNCCYQLLQRCPGGNRLSSGKA